MTTPSLDDLVLYCDDVNNIEARVRAWLPTSNADRWQLVGRIHGPRCAFARTLAATIPLRMADSESGMEGVCCTAIVPDPCLWTPELPMLYDVHVELRQEGTLIGETERPLAIRWLSPRGHDLVLGGRRWVVRGIRNCAILQTPLSSWREAGAAMLLNNPDEEVATQAAQWGIPIVATIQSRTAAEVASELRQWARFSAVVVAAIDASAELPTEIHRPTGGLLLAANCRAQSAPPALPRWAQLWMYESADATAIGHVAASRRHPVIALRPLSKTVDIATARAACDALQRDLAPQVDLAGYIV